MRATIFFTAAWALATASPIALSEDDAKLYEVEVQDEVTPFDVWPSWSNYSNYSNYSNLTSSGKTEAPKLEVIITGGYYQMSNWTSSQDVHVTPLLNSSSLNSTQLYMVADRVQSAISGDEYTGVVVLGSEGALESLGFFLSVVTDTPENVVVTSKLEDGLAVAWSPLSWFRGALVVDDGFIYSGALYSSGSSGWGALGSVASSTPQYWFTPAWPTLLAPWSPIRQNYTNFTEIAASNSSSTNSSSIVPIVYDGYINPSLVSTLSNSIGGLVVVSSGNSTASDLTSAKVPVVFASYDSAISQEDVPQGAIAGGNLSPVKAQLLLTIAITNKVTDPASVKQVFA